MTSENSQNGDSLRSTRGVASFEYNGKSIFVEADVDAVSDALAKHREALRRETDVADRAVELTKQCFFVFRFAGHTWTQIIGRDSWFEPGGAEQMLAGGSYLEELKAAMAVHLNEEDAKALSNELGARVLYYHVSDTAYGLAYSLFADGQIVEKLITGDTCDDEGEDEGLKGEWYSASGESGPADVHAAMPWAEALFERLDAFEPGLNFTLWVGYIQHKPGDKVTIPNKGGELERVDFVALE